MKTIITFLLGILFTQQAFNQVIETENTLTEQQLEQVTANNADLETEDDSYLQQMMLYLKNPVELNRADESALQQLQLLSPLQVQQFLLYRKWLGEIIDLYELQAIPGWDISTIRRLRPYVTLQTAVTAGESFRHRLTGGEHSLLLRASQVLEKSKGYRLAASSTANFYPGSPQHYLLRYKYVFKNILQYGLVAEKDAGEQFFKGKQSQGFDFYSAHLFMRKAGRITALALGDFTVNLGQGLTQWQSLAFKKSADVLNSKREGDILRPYNAAGEINFHRGAGITLRFKNLHFTFFGSYRKTDANAVADPVSGLRYVTSLQTSGYHRTKSETDDKGIQRQLAFGGNLSYRLKRLHLGVNAVQYRFALPLLKAAEPYNLYAFNHNRLGNYSLDYSYTCKNIHLYGEAAVSSGFQKAFIQGMLLSAAPEVDINMLYRHISPGYQSLYSNAFTENTLPANESGWYAGISIRPSGAWRIDASADFYRFPWLKYRVDAPSSGRDYLLQIQYKPGKQLDIYTRYRFGLKAINSNPLQLTTAPVVEQPVKNWRTQFSYRLSRSLTLRNRTELVWFDKNGSNAEQGFLFYVDLLYKPLLKPLSGNIRLQYFETEGYNSRIYAFENDILHSFSIPVFFDQGYRYYINLNYEFNKKLSCWIRWAQTLYLGKTLIGSGLDEINGNKKSEIKLQASYRF